MKRKRKSKIDHVLSASSASDRVRDVIFAWHDFGSYTFHADFNENLHYKIEKKDGDAWQEVMKSQGEWYGAHTFTSVSVGDVHRASFSDDGVSWQQVGGEWAVPETISILIPRVSCQSRYYDIRQEVAGKTEKTVSYVAEAFDGVTWHEVARGDLDVKATISNRSYFSYSTKGIENVQKTKVTVISDTETVVSETNLMQKSDFEKLSVSLVKATTDTYQGGTLKIFCRVAGDIFFKHSATNTIFIEKRTGDTWTQYPTPSFGSITAYSREVTSWYPLEDADASTFRAVQHLPFSTEIVSSNTLSTPEFTPIVFDVDLQKNADNYVVSGTVSGFTAHDAVYWLEHIDTLDPDTKEIWGWQQVGEKIDFTGTGESRDFTVTYTRPDTVGDGLRRMVRICAQYKEHTIFTMCSDPYVVDSKEEDTHEINKRIVSETDDQIIVDWIFSTTASSTFRYTLTDGVERSATASADGSFTVQETLLRSSFTSPVVKISATAADGKAFNAVSVFVGAKPVITLSSFYAKDYLTGISFDISVIASDAPYTVFLERKTVDVVEHWDTYSTYTGQGTFEREISNALGYGDSVGSSFRVKVMYDQCSHTWTSDIISLRPCTIESISEKSAWDSYTYDIVLSGEAGRGVDVRVCESDWSITSTHSYNFDADTKRVQVKVMRGEADRDIYLSVVYPWLGELPSGETMYKMQKSVLKADAPPPPPVHKDAVRLQVLTHEIDAVLCAVASGKSLDEAMKLSKRMEQVWKETRHIIARDTRDSRYYLFKDGVDTKASAYYDGVGDKSVSYSLRETKC